MSKQHRVFLPRILLALSALIAYMPESYAQGSYGTTVNDTCFTYNGTKPYTGCTLCHAASPAPKSQRVEPQWTWWQNQLANDPNTNSPYLYNFCPPQTNQAPNSNISAPANNAIFNLGSTVSFTGTGSDPDNNTPLSYAWNFGGAAPNSAIQNPSITLNTAGTFTVTLTVTDSLGRADPSPATISLTVKDPNANQSPNGTINTPASNTTIKVGDSLTFTGTGSDPDNNTPLNYRWNFGGGAADSTLQNPTVTFNTSGIYTVTFTVTDNKGLSDPTPATRTVSVGSTALTCTDQDNDKFSSVGGVCGPVDCNDFVAAINPGAIEACSDRVDNDCNGNIDGNDAQCKGSSCIGDLLKQVEITSAAWEQDDRELSVKGLWSTAGALVKLTDALTGTVLGTTTVNPSDHQGDSEDEESDHHASNSGDTKSLLWSFELEHLAVAPCRVRAEIDGRTGERDVAYAPANCSGNPPATNKKPSANADTATTKQNVPVNITVLANDTDPDHDTLSIIVFTQPGHGKVTQDGKILMYTPTSGYSGNDSFTYTISDGHGGTAKATVTVTVQKAVTKPIDVVISTASWNKSDKKLLVSGSGGVKNASVKILNANTKAVLKTTKSEDEGKWKAEIEKPAVVPCKVRVEITNGSQSGYAVKPVSNAPSICK